MQALKMKRLSMLPMLAALLALAGCAGVAPDTLKAPRDRTQLLLKEPVQYETSSVFGGRTTQNTIKAGVYIPVREDNDGVFYRGPSPFASSWTKETGMLTTTEGGIYLPRVATEPARIFVVIGSSSRHTPVPTANIATSEAVRQTAMGNVSPVTAGVGAAIGAGIASALSEAEMGRYKIVLGRLQPPGNALRDSLVEAPPGTSLAAGAAPNSSATVANPAPTQNARITGKDTYAAEKLAKAKLCAESPLAILTSKGAGFEEYTVPCASGAQMKMRCEFGSCAVLP